MKYIPSNHYRTFRNQNQSTCFFIYIWVVLLLNICTQTLAIPLSDLDSDGNPNDFQVSAYACDGHYWFRGEYSYDKRQYIKDPPWADADDRILFWQRATNKWLCYKPQIEGSFASCDFENLFDCNVDGISGIEIQWEIIANQSQGLYLRGGTDTNGNHYYYRKTTVDRYIFYDINTLQWIISDAYQGNGTYAVCTQDNFFLCEWVTTGVTAAPTLSPTSRSPTLYPTLYPTLSTINPTLFPTLYPTINPTLYPTINPTLSTINPTLFPTLYPTTNPTLYPTINPTLYPTTIAPTAHPSSIISTFGSIWTDPVHTDTKRNVAVYTIISILCFCILCIVIALIFKYKRAESNKEVQNMDNVVNTAPTEDAVENVAPRAAPVAVKHDPILNAVPRADAIVNADAGAPVAVKHDPVIQMEEMQRDRVHSKNDVVNESPRLNGASGADVVLNTPPGIQEDKGKEESEDEASIEDKMEQNQEREYSAPVLETPGTQTNKEVQNMNTAVNTRTRTAANPMIHMEQMQRDRVDEENDDEQKEGDHVKVTNVNIEPEILGKHTNMEGFDEKMDEKAEQREVMRKWLMDKVGLAEYYDVLVGNGCDSLDVIITITDEQELNDLGIVLKGHTLKLMKEIKRLKSKQNNYTFDKF